MQGFNFYSGEPNHPTVSCIRLHLLDPETRKFEMSLLISLLITVLVIFLVLYLVQMLPLDARAKQIARVIVVVIGIISLLRYLAVF
jgi:hypothetical protein